MGKAKSAKTIDHCLSLAEVAGVVILESILNWVTCTLHNLSLCRTFITRCYRYYYYSPTPTSYGSSRGDSEKNKKLQKVSIVKEVEEDQQKPTMRREDVGMIIMERMGAPRSASQYGYGSDKPMDFLGFHDISTIFEDKEPCMEEVRQVFRIFDDNGDGFIDATELHRVLCMLSFREGADLDACRQMIRTYDENKDGKIDFHEFVQLMEISFC